MSATPHTTTRTWRQSTRSRPADAAEEGEQVDESDDRHLDYENPCLGLGHRCRIGYQVAPNRAFRQSRALGGLAGFLGIASRGILVAASFPMRSLPELLTPYEVSDVLKVHVKTLQTWRRRGQGPAWIAVGRHIRYPRTGLADYLEDNTISAAG